MFGEKGREIARLQKELDDKTDQLAAVEPYLEIAKGIQARVHQDMMSQDPETREQAFASAILAQEREVQEATIEAQIKALPPEKLLGMYATLLGDESVKEPLLRIAAIRQKELERQTYLDELEYEAKINGRLDLTKVHEGEILKIGFFAEALARYDKSYKDRALAGRMITARMHDPSNGQLQVIEDTTGGWTSSSIYHVPNIPKNLHNMPRTPRKLLRDHALFNIGGVIGDTMQDSKLIGARIQPQLTYGADAGICSEGLTYHIKGDLGYAVVGERTILDYNQKRDEH